MEQIENEIGRVSTGLFLMIFRNSYFSLASM